MIWGAIRFSWNETELSFFKMLVPNEKMLIPTMISLRFHVASYFQRHLHYLFQQDNAGPHTVRATMFIMRQTSNRNINQNSER